jgi:hypothetical protein
MTNPTMRIELHLASTDMIKKVMNQFSKKETKTLPNNRNFGSSQNGSSKTSKDHQDSKQLLFFTEETNRCPIE